jgi:hypothetical protein
MEAIVLFTQVSQDESVMSDRWLGKVTEIRLKERCGSNEAKVAKGRVEGHEDPVLIHRMVTTVRV